METCIQTSSKLSRIKSYGLKINITKKILQEPRITTYDRNPSYIIELGQSKIYLGGEQPANNKKFIKDNNIGAIICVMKKSPILINDTEVNHIKFLHIMIDDIMSEKIIDHFETSYHFINDMIEQGRSIYIHCQMGISRSPTIVIAYLMKKFNLSLHSAKSFVVSKRPQVDPNISFYCQLEKYETILTES